MAFDFAEQRSETAVFPPHFDFADIEIKARPVPATAMKWRQTVLAIVADSLDQIEPSRHGENDQIWHREARQRALNFTRLGFSEMALPEKRMRRGNRAGWEIAAVATLGGAYRLLAKCDGVEPVQCAHIFRRFLQNLALAYAPVYGEIDLGVELCPVILAPLKCRALILCAGMLIQGMMRLASPGGLGGRLDIALSEGAAQYALVLALRGQRIDLLDSPEFELAARLCGVFQSDLRITSPGKDGVSILLNFPIADRAQ